MSLTRPSFRIYNTLGRKQKRAVKKILDWFRYDGNGERECQGL